MDLNCSSPPRSAIDTCETKLVAVVHRSSLWQNDCIEKVAHPGVGSRLYKKVMGQ